MSCWDPIPFPLEHTLTRQLGPLRLYFRRRDDEWHIAAVYAETPPDGAPPMPPDEAELAWQRWVVSDGSQGLTLTPVVPDKAVVARPRYPLALPARQEALLYVTLPLWVRVTAQPAGAVLLDIPSARLSKIWFGDFASGELCYSIKTRATRQLDGQPAVTWRVTCPVQVCNQSNHDQLLERLCIHVPHLGVIEGGGRLWTPLVTATFKGDEQVAEVTYGKDSPVTFPALIQHSGPRVPVTEHRLWRAVRNLASMDVF